FGGETPMELDRGQIERVDLVIVYPDGREKHVTLSNNPDDNQHNHHVLAHLAGIYFAPNGQIVSVEKHLHSIQSAETAAKWNQVSTGDDYKPAMILMNTDGSVQVLCGGHRQGHVRTGDATHMARPNN
ncbi:MAG: hypothetical protein ACRD2G_11470, partial [Terriglobia bacterium]